MSQKSKFLINLQFFTMTSQNRKFSNLKKFFFKITINVKKIQNFLNSHILTMTIKINILNKRIQIKQIVREIRFILQFHCPCSYPVGTRSQIS